MDEQAPSELAAYIFNRSANYIRTFGWQETGMSRHGLPRCSMGAIDSGSRGIIWTTELAVLMYDALYETLNGLSLSEFNHRHNNGEKVAQLFDRVAAQLLNSDALKLKRYSLIND